MLLVEKLESEGSATATDPSRKIKVSPVSGTKSTEKGKTNANRRRNVDFFSFITFVLAFVLFNIIYWMTVL